MEISTNTEAKEIETMNFVTDVLKAYKGKKIVVACSWGKDSLVVLHMALRVAKQLNIKIDVLWNNTQVAYPSIYQTKSKLEAEWELNVITAKPTTIKISSTEEVKADFWNIINNIGWPGFKGAERKNKANNMCCYHLKKKPTKEAIKANEWDLYFDGLTAKESDTRYMSIREYGLYHYHKTFKLYKAHPIANWRVADVWNYIDKHSIPYPKLYDQEVEGHTKLGYTELIGGIEFDRAIRTGCWCCTIALSINPGKMKQLRTYYPRLWRHLLIDRGLAREIAKVKLKAEGALFDSYFTKEMQENFLEKRPCFFDQI